MKYNRSITYSALKYKFWLKYINKETKYEICQIIWSEELLIDGKLLKLKIGF